MCDGNGMVPGAAIAVLLAAALMVAAVATMPVTGTPVSTSPSPPSPPPSPPAGTAMEFMKRYGYLDPGIPNSEALYKEDAIVEAIKTMQKFGGIAQTGKLDNDTLKLMNAKRCGVPDIIHKKRAKRYIIGSEGWRKRNITYFVANWTPKLGEENVVHEIQKAFDSWSGYSRLQFTHVQDPNADIIIAFGRGPHGDYYPFDGPGNILAHAYFPYEDGSYGGDIHFDDDEEWTMRPGEFDSGIDFFMVAVHELGHSLGLAHSPVSGSIMFPYYKGYQPHFQLDYDDILAVYELYISRKLEDDRFQANQPSTEDTSKEDEFEDHTERVPDQHDETTDKMHDDEQVDSASTMATPTTPTDSIYLPSPTPEYNFSYVGDDEHVDDHIRRSSTEISPTLRPSTVDICKGNFDAISVLRNELFIFKDKYVWRLLRKSEVLPGYPVLTRQFFWAMPPTITQIDAVYERETDHSIIFFTGNKYWVHDGDKFIENSPQPITHYGLPPDLERIDAAFVWGKNGKTFLFSGSDYWRYNETTRKMDTGYPHRITRWRGVPENLDAAMTWTDGLTYFFKGNMFWRFNNYLIKTDESYPLPAAQYWIGCP